MKRCAILIQAPLSGANYLKGVAVDIACWRKHLKTLSGGAWLDEEIVLLKNPTKSSLLNALTLAKFADYSIVIFSGHGFVKKGPLGFPETWVYINDSANEEDATFSVNKLNPGTPRCIISVDCCRKYIETSLLTESQRSFSNVELRQYYRNLFDKQVLNCEKGCCRIYGAKIGESANDDLSFSQVLMKIAEIKGKENISSTVQECVNEAIMAFMNIHPQQHPSYNGGRRLKHFPLVIGGMHQCVID